MGRVKCASSGRYGVVTVLNNSVAVVTGGARGLGRVIAETIAALGADTVSIDLDESGETVAAIHDSGGRASSHTADLTDKEQVDNVFDKIIRQHKAVDILVNNAGFYAVDRRPFWEIEPEEWEQVMRVNLRPAFLCSCAVSKAMRDQGSGRIINISSSVITFGMPNLMHYVAAKSALVGMTRSMARELGPYGINANVVAPGLVPTDTAMEAVGHELLDSAVQAQVIQQPLAPRDVAGAVAYLCAPEAGMITGQTIVVNGGATFSGI